MSADPTRRFPAPWRVDKSPGGHVVGDANGQALAYVYSRDNEAEARQAKVLTSDEGRRIAANFARLPQLSAVILGGISLLEGGVQAQPGR
jgi:hypothetical protein